MTTTFRNAIFQVHWFLGITAGLVLALVGVTGAMLSFEDEVLKALNPGVITVAPRGAALAPDALVARILAQQPDARLLSLARSADPRDTAKAGFAPASDAKGADGKKPRGESRYVDPYSGALLAKPRGEGFFRTTMQLHRWLAVDEVGKQIVGFSTVALIFFCLSGLYMRWPRKPLDWRAWLKLDTRQKGRNFLWHLHSIVGTWVLLAYLVMALTGLWWSYDWYRDGLNRLAGVPQQSQQRPVGGERGKPRDAGSMRASSAPEGTPDIDVAAAWRAFETAAPAWSTATLQWPRDGGGVQFRYLDAEPPHERANNQIELDAATLAVIKHERYDQKPAAQRVVGSMFTLHRGSYFGLAGVLLFMLASLLMPLFAITGWMLYLDRRGKKRAARSAQDALPTPVAARGDSPVVIAYASQTGSAELLAWKTAASLRDAGMAVSVLPLGQFHAGNLVDAGRILFVVSTFGDGQPPDNARAFARRVMASPASLSTLRYGVLSLGDASYETFCGFGRALDAWLHHNGATPMFDRIDVNDGDAGALRHWQHHLGVLSGDTDVPDWTAPRYEPWRLSERRVLNPDSDGHPAVHIALTPPQGATLDWQAGDIVEIGPRHAAAAVQHYLAETGLDGNAVMRTPDGNVPLHALLATSLWPDAVTIAGTDAQALADTLKPLPHREYSIASLPQDGRIELLIRQFRRPDGKPGLGAGWLTTSAPIGADIAARLRTNNTFHAPDDARPLLLIGNGTGIAGLRALLKLRARRGHHRNWLVFGERHRARDYFYGEELEAWRASGVIERLDLAFSRDGQSKHYVQHVLADAAADVRDWVDAGASIYVCGSLQGMAPGVDGALTAILGVDAMETMAATGRYRRDVY